MPGRPLKPEDEESDGALFLPIETNLAKHHILTLNALEEVSVTPYGRLLIMMPPGSAKSTYGSVVFPSRYLGKHPGSRLILVSYGDDLARKMGRRTRSVIQQPTYRGIYNTQISAASSAAQEFALTNGSEYMACGLNSGITGNRGNGLIGDDLIKGREAAESETIRQKVWDMWVDDGISRLVPGGFAVLIMTHWHQDDPAGRILPDGWHGESGFFEGKDGMTWRVICLQALCETETDPLGRVPGEYLWPEWFTRRHWAQFENMPRTWGSLYQQVPAPKQGIFFEPDKISVCRAIPFGTRFCRGWDLASQENEGDWTAGVQLGVMPDGRYLIADVARFQGKPHMVEAGIVNAAGRDGQSTTVSIPQDPGQAGVSQIAYLTKALAGFIVHASPESGDKMTRAESYASQVNVGNVVMLEAEWNSKYIDELRVFPNGKYDDQVDASSRAFNQLAGGTSWAFGSIPNG